MVSKSRSIGKKRQSRRKYATTQIILPLPIYSGYIFPLSQNAAGNILSEGVSPPRTPSMSPPGNRQSAISVSYNTSNRGSIPLIRTPPRSGQSVVSVSSNSSSRSNSMPNLSSGLSSLTSQSLQDVQELQDLQDAKMADWLLDQFHKGTLPTIKTS